ncbi:NADPH-dependent ferric siderophore reductase [Sphaerotilus hippei]|uniref:NADPH-dependent ferric siderophore reductase n=1 Tax=Sphaerotilus hippei TaxID=744406 RepID=A0A318H2P3_9BURK|nr:siderophore-interacting protein [Sphaerotilus hippei]PXW97628.1 NADPH-dependent ferric siderophore reductase [Sphaerotilus hippei]
MNTRTEPEPLPASPPASLRRVERVRHELKRRHLVVRRVADLSPQVRRITFAGDELGDFVSASFDDHVKLMWPAPEGVEPVRRDYTPRRFDPVAGELDIEFALHGHGPAAAWAAQAAPGQTLMIGGPRGSFIIPTDFDWHLLVGDLSALPAIARRLEELPATARVLVIADVPEGDRRELASAARVQLQWVDGEAATLAAARQLTLPAGEGHVWCAGEARTMAALRHVLVEEQGVNRHAIRAAAYWKRGAAAHHAHLED